MDDLLEREIERYLVRKIKEYGGIAYKFTSPARRSVPDRLCIMPGGKHFFVEVKRKGGKLTPLQSVEIKRITTLDHKVYTVYGKDDVISLLTFLREEYGG